MIRTRGLPFIDSRAAAPLMADEPASSSPPGCCCPAAPSARALRLQPLPPPYFGWLAALLLAYGAAVQCMKHRYIARHAWR